MPKRTLRTPHRQPTAFAEPQTRQCGRQGCQQLMPASSEHKSCPHCYQFHHYTSTVNLGMALQLAPSATLIGLHYHCLSAQAPGLTALADALTAELARRTFEGA